MNETVVTTTTAAVLSLALAASPAVAGKQVLPKVPVWFSTHLTGLGSTPKWLPEHVNEGSGGSIKLKSDEPEKRIPPKAMLESVSKGQVNGGRSTPGYNAGFPGETGAIFSVVPCGPDAPEFLAWVYDGDGRLLWQETYDKAG